MDSPLSGNNQDQFNPQPSTPSADLPGTPDKKSSGKKLFVIIAAPLAALFIILGGVLLYYFTFSGSALEVEQTNQSEVNMHSASPADSPETSPQAVALQEASVEDITQAHNTFGLRIFKELNGDGENVVISPASISIAFAMVYHGARDETREEMAEVLGYEGFSQESLHTETSQLISRFNNLQDTTLRIANSLWLNSNIGADKAVLKEAFVTDNETYYFSEARTIDFSQPDASDIINGWIAEKTDDKITNIIPGRIPQSTLLYVINALYFNGSWQGSYEFEAFNTIERPFRVDEETEISIETMSQMNSFQYAETEGFQAVKIPFEETSDSGIEMTFFLPKEDEYEGFLESFTPEQIEQWSELFSQQYGQLYLPKFTLESDYDLGDTIEKEMGMKQAFDSNESDFKDGIVTKESTAVYIDQVLHNTFIEVSEEGVEAAAATAIGIPIAGGGSAEEIAFTMNINRPFFFTITEEQTGEIFFIGFVQRPSDT
jgi:serpin B